MLETKLDQSAGTGVVKWSLWLPAKPELCVWFRLTPVRPVPSGSVWLRLVPYGSSPGSVWFRLVPYGSRLVRGQ